MKKTLIFPLAVAALFLASCGGNETKEEKKDTTAPTTEAPKPAENTPAPAENTTTPTPKNKEGTKVNVGTNGASVESKGTKVNVSKEGASLEVKK